MIGKVAVVLGISVFVFILVNAMYELPDFGKFENRDVAQYYLDRGLQETGSGNVVNAIIWDFRGLDTMGEETVLFSAAMRIFLLLWRKNGRNSTGGENSNVC